MAIGTLAWNLMMPHGHVTAGLVATRKELRAAAAVTRDNTSVTQQYGDAVDYLRNLLNKELITAEAYRAKEAKLTQEKLESTAAWQKQNAIEQKAIAIKEGLRSAEQRALGPMREARDARKAGELKKAQYEARLKQIKSTLPTVVAAEKMLADERRRAEQITRQNMTAAERYKQAVKELPAILQTTARGQETYRREVARLRQELLSSVPSVNRFGGSLLGSVGRIAGPVAALTDAQSALGMNVGTTSQKMANMTRVGDVLTKGNMLANASIDRKARTSIDKGCLVRRSFGDPTEGSTDQSQSRSCQGSDLAALSHRVVALWVAARRIGRAVVGPRRAVLHRSIRTAPSFQNLRRSPKRATRSILTNDTGLC